VTVSIHAVLHVQGFWAWIYSFPCTYYTILIGFVSSFRWFFIVQQTLIEKREEWSVMGRQNGQMSMAIWDIAELIPSDHLLRKIRWVVSIVMRKIDSGLWQKSITGDG
ncbi:hypothetical protein, partial [Hominenteromicrobium sp.]|uniref:hypothetical protein n=1 Tax=Hominenteromicrobium sp. TaxID=3073581 RepID=UPI003A948377